VEVPAEENQDEAEPNGCRGHLPVPDRHLRRRRRRSCRSEQAAAASRVSAVAGAGAVWQWAYFFSLGRPRFFWLDWTRAGIVIGPLLCHCRPHYSFQAFMVFTFFIKTKE